MTEWLRDKVMWLRLTTLRYFLSRKEQKSVVLPKKRSCTRRWRKKTIFSDISDHILNDTKESSVKQYGLWRLLKATR